MSLTRRASAVVAPIVAAILAAGTLVGSANAESSPPDRHLRVMSFNIHHGAGIDGVLDLDRTAATIRQEAPDVVGLQEVDHHFGSRSDFVDQTRALADKLHMHAVFGANLDLAPTNPGDPRRQYGTAILSRWPILESENTLLPRYDDHEQRGLLYARVLVKGVPVAAYTTHLQHNTPAEQLDQAQAVADVVNESSDPAVLTGDMNVRPDSAPAQVLTGSLTDAWVAGGDDGPGYTFHTGDLTARIDYVMTSTDVTVEHTKVVDSVASDHLPVVADVRVPAEDPGVG